MGPSGLQECALMKRQWSCLPGSWKPWSLLSIVFFKKSLNNSIKFYPVLDFRGIQTD